MFAKDCLKADEEGFLKIGNKDSESDTLYSHYLKWCEINGVTPDSQKGFSIQNFLLLKQIGWNVEKKDWILDLLFKVLH